MKSPLIMWASAVKARLRKDFNPVTTEIVFQYMVLEDDDEVRDFFFQGVPPTRDLSEIVMRLDLLMFAAKKVTVN